MKRAMQALGVVVFAGLAVLMPATAYTRCITVSDGTNFCQETCWFYDDNTGRLQGWVKFKC